MVTAAAAELLSIAQVGQAFGVKRTTLMWAITHGHLEATKIGRQWVTTPAAVRHWLQYGKHRRGPVLGSKHPRKRKEHG